MPILKADANPHGNPKKVYGEKGQKVEILSTYTGPNGTYHLVKLTRNKEKPPFDVAANNLI